MQLLLLGGTTITKKKNDGVTASTASLNLPAGYSVANIFTAKAGNGSYEELGEIVTASKNDYTSYQIQVYTDLKNPSNPVSGTPAYAEPFEYTQALAGIDTIPLPEPVLLAPGSQYSVVITVTETRFPTMWKNLKTSAGSPFLPTPARTRAFIPEMDLPGLMLGSLQIRIAFRLRRIRRL